MCETNSFRFWVFQVVALSAILVLILWLTLRTKSPTFTVENLSIPALANSPDHQMISPAATTTNSTNTTTVIRFDLKIKNPNKDYSIWYSGLNITVYNGSNDTCVLGNVPKDLQQDKDESTTIANIDVTVANERLWSELVQAVANETAKLEVGLVTQIKYKMGALRSKRHGLHFRGKTKIGKDGKILGKKKSIELHKFKKRRL